MLLGMCKSCPDAKTTQDTRSIDKIEETARDRAVPNLVAIIRESAYLRAGCRQLSCIYLGH